MKARIGIIDDHPAVALGVTAIINAQPMLHVVGSAPTVRALLAQEDRFDLILLDLQLADGSTPQDNLRALKPTGAPVLAYTSGDQPRLVRDAARAGAVGMVRKSEIPVELVRAVLAALNRDPIITPDWAAALEGDRDFVNAKLSPREAEVLALYASGQTAEGVAAILFITRETVIDHIRRIRAKYVAADRPAPTKVDLYRRAIEDGLIPPEA